MTLTDRARIDEIRDIYLTAVVTAERYSGTLPRAGAATPARCILWHVEELKQHVEAWLAAEVRANKIGDELPSWAAIERRLNQKDAA